MPALTDSTLADFRDRHRSGTVLVCGCGESLNLLDHPERFVTIGVNDVGRKFDPTYLVYTAGKLALLKLRADWQAKQGGKLSLRAFHDTLLSHGSAPIWALRRLMLGHDAEAVLE